jgi:hypothetical protein
MTTPKLLAQGRCLIRQILLVSTFAAGLAAPVLGQSHEHWKYRQELRVPSAGLVRAGIPWETLDALRPNLGDLRLVNPDGVETSFAVDRPFSIPPVTRQPRTFAVELGSSETVIRMETGLDKPVRGVLLHTPAKEFLKAIRIEGSQDGRDWKTVLQGVPVFRQADGAGQLHMELPPAVWRWLRLTVDDHSTKPIPFTGATLFAATGDETMPEIHPVQILERTEEPGATRLLIDLGSSNLRLAALNIGASDPLLRRMVTLAVKREADGVVSEQIIGHATIYRISVEGQPPVSQMDARFAVVATPARQLILRIGNDSNPPLQITNITSRCLPLNLAFHARSAGIFSLYSGNPSAPSAHYDISDLGMNLRQTPLTAVDCQPRVANPSYRVEETLPQVTDTGAPIDVKPWLFRKRVVVQQSGVQQLELDLEALAHAGASFADLRLVREGRQIPFVIEDSSLERHFPVDAVPEIDRDRPQVSRWLLKLPQKNLPLTRLSCVSATPLFRRNVVVFEESATRPDGRRVLGTATWVRASESASSILTLPLSGTTESDHLYLETENGDNPPVDLSRFEVQHRTARLLFKTAAAEGVSLYYGNADASAPSYDLSLVSGQLRSAEKNTATLGSEEQVRKPSWHEAITGGRGDNKGSLILWIVLAGVVVVLLGLITKLVPKHDGENEKQPDNNVHKS